MAAPVEWRRDARRTVPGLAQALSSRLILTSRDATKRPHIILPPPGAPPPRTPSPLTPAAPAPPATRSARLPHARPASPAASRAAALRAAAPAAVAAPPPRKRRAATPPARLTAPPHPPPAPVRPASADGAARKSVSFGPPPPIPKRARTAGRPPLPLPAAAAAAAATTPPRAPRPLPARPLPPLPPRRLNYGAGKQGGVLVEAAAAPPAWLTALSGSSRAWRALVLGRAQGRASGEAA